MTHHCDLTTEASGKHADVCVGLKHTSDDMLLCFMLQRLSRCVAADTLVLHLQLLHDGHLLDRPGRHDPVAHLTQRLRQVHTR